SRVVAASPPAATVPDSVHTQMPRTVVAPPVIALSALEVAAIVNPAAAPASANAADGPTHGMRSRERMMPATHAASIAAGMSKAPMVPVSRENDRHEAPAKPIATTPIAPDVTSRPSFRTHTARPD